jgi:hypothetical protein
VLGLTNTGGELVNVTARQQALQRGLQQILARFGPAGQQRRDSQQWPAPLGEELLELGDPLVCRHPQPPECRSPHQARTGGWKR